MKKNFLMGLSALVLLGTVVGCVKPAPSTSSQGGSQGGQPSSNQGGSSVANPLAGTYDIKVWVSESKGVKELTEQQIDAFEESNPGIILNAAVEGVSEANSATQMITDVESGADIFCFAQDQLSRLIQVGALNPLGKAATEEVKASHDVNAITASTVGENIYCYPLTSDNGYFMYYDKSVVKPESLDSLEAILADCAAAKKNFSFETDTSGWYNASWFFATGCKNDWTVNEEGKFTAVDDTFNSDAGLVALKGMKQLAQHPNHVSSSAGSDFEAAVPSAVVVTGTWESRTIKEILGDNFGATDLPSFTVDGKSYHLGSFKGCKLMGVKPQLDSKKAAVLQKLALYLTGEKCQLERYDAVGWGPSNLEAQKADRVKNDVALNALAAQDPYAKVQGQIHGSWWDISKSYAKTADTATTDDELKEALKSYKDAIDGLFSMTEDQKLAFGVVGSNKAGQLSWETDIVMEQKPKGTYYTTTPILFAEGDQFKIRQGKSWTVNFGQDGKFDGSNITITAANAGYYFVKMVMKSGTAEDAAGATVEITLEKYNPSYSWSAIGTLGGTNWDKDFYLTQVSETEYLSDPVEFAAGQEYKVRYGTNWDLNYGADGVKGGANIACATAGTYQVKLTLEGETAKVELVPVA